MDSRRRLIPATASLTILLLSPGLPTSSYASEHRSPLPIDNQTLSLGVLLEKASLAVMAKSTQPAIILCITLTSFNDGGCPF